MASLLEPVLLEERAAAGINYFPDTPSNVVGWLLYAIYSYIVWVSAIADSPTLSEYMASCTHASTF